MVNPGSKRKFEKGLVKVRGAWPTKYKLHMMEIVLSWGLSSANRSIMTIMTSVDPYLNKDEDAVT